jgi:hypothetical protein
MICGESSAEGEEAGMTRMEGGMGYEVRIPGWNESRQMNGEIWMVRVRFGRDDQSSRFICGGLQVRSGHRG